MDTRSISYGSPFKGLSPEEIADLYVGAAKEQAIQQQMAALQDAPVEQPWFDPVDTVTGGLMAIPRGAVNVAADMGLDALLGLGLDRAFGNEALPAMFIGKKGIQKLGMNAERDLFGQFSGLWDKGVRAELDDGGSVFSPDILLGNPRDVAEQRMAVLRNKIDDVKRSGDRSRIDEYRKLQRDFDDAKELRAYGYGDYGERGVPLSEIINHPSYTAYNELGSIRTIPESGGATNNVYGGYSAENNLMTLNASKGDELRDTVNHELQHAVQYKEGFARGGSPEMFDTSDSPYDAYHRLAGEWEARNAGTRAVLPPDDPRLGNALTQNGVDFRTGSPFSTADDIPLDDMIVRMDGGEARSANHAGRYKRLYRGLEGEFNPNYDITKTDAPNGYSTWTDNQDLARQYAGKSGQVYYVDLPKEMQGGDIFDEAGDRAFFFNNNKPASLNGISGEEYLLYLDHEMYNPRQIKNVK